MALVQYVNTNDVIHTPQRNYIRRLTKTSERLRAENSILTRRNKDMEAVLSARKEREKGKRIALKDQLLLTTEELHAAVVAIEKEGEDKNKKKGKRKCRRSITPSENGSKDGNEASDDTPIVRTEISDCIQVAPF